MCGRKEQILLGERLRREGDGDGELQVAIGEVGFRDGERTRAIHKDRVRLGQHRLVGDNSYLATLQRTGDRRIAFLQAHRHADTTLGNIQVGDAQLIGIDNLAILHLEGPAQRLGHLIGRRAGDRMVAARRGLEKFNLFAEIDSWSPL